MISGPKIQGEWKIQLRIAIKFFSSKNSKSNHIEMHSKSNHIEIMIANEIDEIIDELFDCFDDSVDLLLYKCHKIGLNRGGSYIDSPKWLKNEKQQH